MEKHKIDKKTELKSVFSLRTANVLYRAGIETVEDLEKQREVDLLNIHGFGNASLRELFIVCEFTDITLKPNVLGSWN